MRHNPLYGDVIIDYPAMVYWPDEFIPLDIQRQVIFVDEMDHHERAGYSVNLQEGNYKNNWQAAAVDHN